MKAKKYSFILLLLSLFLLSEGMQSSVVADTSTDTITIVLHKRVWKDEIPEQHTNSGKEMDFGGQPLPGVTFNIYDVTKRYYEAEKQSGFSVKEYMNGWSKKSLEDIANEQLGQPLATKVTDGSGEIIISLPSKVEGKDAVYLIVETAVNMPKGFSEDKESSVPMLMVLPIMDTTENRALTTIHVYPKNVFKTEPVVPDKPATPTKPVTPQKTNHLPDTGQAKSKLAILGFAMIIFVVVILGSRKKRGEK